MSDTRNITIDRLIDSINRNNIYEIEAIINLPGFNQAISNDFLFSPLHVAVWGYKPEISKLLIDAGCDVNEKEKISGKTPIFNAYSFESIKDLIDAGADVNIQDKHDNNTILHGQYFQHSIVNLILDSGFDVSLKNRMGWNILHYHTANGHHWLLEDMLNAGIDVDDQTHDGQTAMTIANYYREDECYTILERFKFKKMFIRESRNYEGLGM